MKIAFRSLLAVFAIALVAMAAQQYRYFETRSDVLGRRPPLEVTEERELPRWDPRRGLT